MKNIIQKFIASEWFATMILIAMILAVSMTMGCVTDNDGFVRAGPCAA